MNTPQGGVALAALRLDDAELIESGDPGGMLRQVASSAAQVRTALRACAETDLSQLSPDVRPRAIVVAGSGGAGGAVFACDALAAICGTGSPVQVTGVSGYQLPGWIGATDLVIAVSRSGHTAETIALAGEAARRGCHLVGVGAPGSPLQELAARARGTFIPVTTVGPARAMAWALTVPLLVAAARLGVARIDEADYEAAAAVMEDVSHQCRPSSESFVNPAKSLALDLVGRLPVIWGGSDARGGGGAPVRLAARRERQVPGDRRRAAGRRARPGGRVRRSRTRRRPSRPSPPPRTSDGSGDYPRTDSTTAEFDSFSDAGDDELGLDGPPMDEAQLRLVLLADQAGEHPVVERTRIAAASLAQARGIDVSEIAMEGGGPLRRLAGMVQLIDYASVYLGIASGIDPLAIAAIKDLRDLTGRE